MKVIKNINNNVSLCLDSNGKEVIVFGKGIGFKKPPYDLELPQIQRTYYDVDEAYLSMINDIPEDVIKVSDTIVNYARGKLPNSISSNIVFTLADHINFCIKRYNKGLMFNLPIENDIEQLFETEMDIGIYSINVIKDVLHIRLPKEEAVYIALHFINAEENRKSEIDNEKLIEDIVEIVEKDFDLTINKENFNYSRFISHMHYLLKRGKKKEMIQTENQKMYESLVSANRKASECANEISNYLLIKNSMNLSDEEKMYLILHINRLCSRESISK